MKKILLFSAAIATALVANAEVFDYGFNYNSPAFPLFGEFDNEESDLYKPNTNVDLVDKYGKAMPALDGIKMITADEEDPSHGILTVGVAISMLDGGVYKLNPDAVIYDEEFADLIEEMPAENYAYPFLSWGEKGVTRTIFMSGWGSEEAWEDAAYNAAVEADWVSTKNGIQFTRLGHLDIVSRQDTYIQFPAVTGDVTVTVWAGTNDSDIKVLVTPVIDGVADPEQAVELNKEGVTAKRYYKLDPVTFDAKGKNMALRVGCNGTGLNLMHVRIEGEKGENAVDGIQAVEAADAKAYNMLGVQVDDSYKGLVIKNGKKFVQK